MTIPSLPRVLIPLVLALAALCAGPAPASEPSIETVGLTERGRDLVLNADVSLDLNSQLEDAADRGLPLYFTAEVEILRPRWYWFDQTVLSASQTWRIIHNPLTRQWRVSSGVLALPVGSLSEALSVVRHVRGWRIAERGLLKEGTDYEGRMRVRFDVSQLSKPFQVNALNSSDWSLSTPWTSFSTRVTRDSASNVPPPPTPPPPTRLPPSTPLPPGSPDASGMGLSLPESLGGTQGGLGIQGSGSNGGSGAASAGEPAPGAAASGSAPPAPETP